MTVFVVQEVPGRNILSAENYGKLELLLPKGTQLVLSSQPTVNKLKRNRKDMRKRERRKKNTQEVKDTSSYAFNRPVMYSPFSIDHFERQ